jgi:membrane peptidoglycan carboxypeptidase
VVSPETAGKLSTMLTKVVQEGTGTNAVVPGYLAAGKTGTARKPLEGARGYSGNYVASFVGYVPSQDPRLAAVVVLDEPTPIYGGQVSAPVFARIMQYALRLERIPPPPGSPTAPPAPDAPTRALDEEPANDDPNVPKASTTTTTKPKSAPRASTTTSTTKPTTRSTTRSTTKSSTTTTTRRPTSKSSTTTTTARGSTTGSTRPKSTASSSTTTTTRPKSRSAASQDGASGDRRSDTLGRDEGRSTPPSSGQSTR